MLKSRPPAERKEEGKETVMRISGVFPSGEPVVEGRERQLNSISVVFPPDSHRFAGFFLRKRKNLKNRRKRGAPYQL